MDLKKSEIIPDVLPSVSGDVAALTVSYGDNNVSFGSELTPAQSNGEPTVSWTNDGSKFYTLFMTDPDAPSRENHSFREFIHWVVTDIPGDDVKSGVTVMGYLGPAPPHASGLHRYCFFAYEQKEKGVVDVDEAKKMYEGRGGKKIMDLVTKSALGDPIASNLMVSQWGEECDAYHEGMGWMPPQGFRSPAQQQKTAASEEKKAAGLEVGYWKIRGLAAPLRMICEYAEAPYTCPLYECHKVEGKWNKDEWFKDAKPGIKARNPLANLPFVVDGDNLICQSNACLKYLGRKFNLYGKDITEKTKVDQCLCQAMDLRNDMVKCFYGPGGDAYESRKASLMKGAPRHYTKFEGWLSQNGTTYCLSDSPCIADFHLWELFDQMEMFMTHYGKESLLKDRPNCQKLYSKMKDIGKLSNYFKGDLYALPVNNKMANWIN